MKVITDKAAFDKLLKDDKKAALEQLKDDTENYFDEVQIGEQKYKIFTKAPDNLFNQKNSCLLSK